MECQTEGSHFIPLPASFSLRPVDTFLSYFSSPFYLVLVLTHTSSELSDPMQKGKLFSMRTTLD